MFSRREFIAGLSRGVLVATVGPLFLQAAEAARATEPAPRNLPKDLLAIRHEVAVRELRKEVPIGETIEVRGFLLEKRPDEGPEGYCWYIQEPETRLVNL